MTSVPRFTLFLKIGLVVLTALLSSVRASGVDQAQTAGAPKPVSPESLSRKLKLLENFTQSEETKKRLEESNDPDARSHFDAAINAWQAASRAFAAEDFETASVAISTGYEQMMIALRRSQDAKRQAQRDVARYDELSRRVFSFSEAFQRIAYEKNDPGIYRLLDQDEMNRLLADAGSFATEERHEEANELMQQAALIVERALSSARDRETLIQELSFATPADEFDYELRRNESYELLVRLLEQQGKGRQRSIQMMQEVLARNRAARAEAQELFDKGEHEAAIGMLEKRSEEVSRALQMSGLAF